MLPSWSLPAEWICLGLWRGQKKCRSMRDWPSATRRLRWNGWRGMINRVELPIFLLFPADRGGELVRCAQLRAQNQVYIRCQGWESENWPEMIIISLNGNVQGAQLGSPLTLVRSTLRLCRSQCHGVKISESRTSLFLLPQRANNGKGDSYNFKIEWDMGFSVPEASKLDHLQLI